MLLYWFAFLCWSCCYATSQAVDVQITVFALRVFKRGRVDVNDGGGFFGGGDDVKEPEKIETPAGDVIDNNGPVEGIVGSDGTLPDNSIVAPIVGDDGVPPPITEHPGAPDVISNRLNIYFENRDVDLDAFARELSGIYTESQCMIIGADKNIPMIQIKIQEIQLRHYQER